MKDMEALDASQARGRQVALALEQERQRAEKTQVQLRETQAQIERDRHKPIYKRAWFWGVLGGAIGLTVAAVTTAVVVGTRQTDLQMLPTIMTVTINN
jgi:hypothetical protein